MTHSIRLIRDPLDGEKTKSLPQLGDVLKEKASEGVQVLVSYCTLIFISFALSLGLDRGIYSLAG